MKLLIATPAFGGQLTTQYFGSALQTAHGLMEAGVSHAFYLLDNESLIPRARNKCAQYALDMGYDKILFIDADMSWTYEDVRKLLNSKHLIIGGTYPIKMYPIKLNFNHLPGAIESEGGEVEVRHLPTGFMLIDRSVLTTLRDEGGAESYTSLDAATGQVVEYHDFFPTGVKDERYLSEDWGFCELARSAGFKVYLNTKVILGHVGTHHYRVDFNQI